MDDVVGVVVTLVLAMVMSVFGYIMGESDGAQAVKKEAFERGAMVQCVGRTGYYWECEE